MSDITDSTDRLIVGGYEKVNLPGETPYVEILSITNDDKFIGRIANKLFSEFSEFERAKFTNDQFGDVMPLPKLHSYKQDQVVEFVKYYHVFDGNTYLEWRPV